MRRTDPSLKSRPREAGGTPDTQPALSPARAFVVQFREGTAGASVRFTGRVEHVSSGHAARFESAEELLAFFVDALSVGQPERSERG